MLAAAAVLLLALLVLSSVVLMHVAWCSLSNECCFFSTDETSLLTQHFYNKKGCDGKTRTQIYLDKGLL